MAKLTESTITLTGKSGKEYKFEIYSLDTKFNAVTAVYLFSRRYKTDDVYRHSYIYLGYTTDLSTRFDNHHKAACIKKNDANCVCIYRADTEKAAIAAEEDILAAINFPCNEVNN